MALTLEQIYEAAENAGDETAMGSDGIVHLAKITFLGARAKLVTSKDVSEVYKRYLVRANLGEFARQIPVTDDAIKYGASKLRAFVKFAARKGTKEEVWSLISKALVPINSKNVSKGPGSNYEQLLKVVRFANNADKWNLSEDEILTALAPKDVKDPVGAALRALRNRAETMMKSESTPIQLRYHFQNIFDVAASEYEAYKATIVAAGGDLPNEAEDDDEVNLDDLLKAA